MKITFVCRYSADEGQNWSEAIPCLTCPGYYVVANDRLLRTKNGRLIFPMSYAGDSYPDCIRPASIRFAYSDDNGRHWDMLPQTIRSPYQKKVRVGLQEPGMLEFEDGMLWAYFRTEYGHQYESFSYDGGENWTTPEPNFHFTSPDSPMLVKKVGQYVIALFNPVAYNCTNQLFEYWPSPRRTPLVCAISTDGGKTFVDTTDPMPFTAFTAQCFLLEDDPTNSFCYSAAIEVPGGFLVAYYHSNNTGFCLDSAKIVKVIVKENGQPT